MAEHRVPMLGSSWRRYGEPSASSDPRIRALVGAPARPSSRPAMRADFRAELRAQLVAITPRRLVAEGTAAAPRRGPRPQAPRAAGQSVAARGTPTAHRRCAASASAVRCVAVVVAVFAMLLGGAVVLSRRHCRATRCTASSGRARTSSWLTAGNDTEKAKELAVSFAPDRAKRGRATCCRATPRPAARACPPTGGVSSTRPSWSRAPWLGRRRRPQAAAAARQPGRPRRSSAQPLVDHDQLGAGPARSACRIRRASCPSGSLRSQTAVASAQLLAPPTPGPTR